MPALAYPDTVLTNDVPEAVIEKTIKIRVCAASEILRPVVNPDDTVPIATMPVIAGDNVTIAPEMGLNMLLGVVDS